MFSKQHRNRISIPPAKWRCITLQSRRTRNCTDLRSHPGWVNQQYPQSPTTAHGRNTCTLRQNFRMPMEFPPAIYDPPHCTHAIMLQPIGPAITPTVATVNPPDRKHRTRFICIHRHCHKHQKLRRKYIRPCPPALLNARNSKRIKGSFCFISNHL